MTNKIQPLQKELIIHTAFHLTLDRKNVELKNKLNELVKKELDKKRD